MRTNLGSVMRIAGAAFLVGAITSVIGTIIGLCWTFEIDPGSAVDEIGERSDLYLLVFVSSGLAWVPLAVLLWRLSATVGWVGWLVRIAVTTVVMGPLSLIFEILLRAVFTNEEWPPGYFGHMSTWFGDLTIGPYNAIALVRATILVSIAVLPAGSVPGIRVRAFPPGLGRGGEQDQVTRLLCGQAILSGSFRRKVLAFFENKWTAVAPEFGLDAELLVRVSHSAETRDRIFYWGFACLAVVGLILFAISPALGLPLAILASAFLWFTKARAQHAQAQLFARGDFSKAAAARQFAVPPSREIAPALPTAEQNLVVYRGFTPFVGAGFDLGGWSFVTFVDRPKVEGAKTSVQSFDIPELYVALDARLESVRLSNMNCRDYFFVRGVDIKGDPDILGDLADRPRKVLSAALATIDADEQDTRIRQYKCLQLVDWGGEVIISYFLRCALQGNMLLVEMKRYVLPPVADAQRSVDALRPDSITVRIGHAIAAIVAGPVMTVVAPFIVLGLASAGLGRMLTSEAKQAKRRRERAENDPAYDFGAETTLRAMYAQNRYLHYFQKSDGEFGNKLIERKILHEVETFLDARGIDTSDIRERQTTILNSGILVQGGDVKAEALAVGDNAKASKIRSARSVARSKETAG
jgi:hypothetical protein